MQYATIIATLFAAVATAAPTEHPPSNGGSSCGSGHAQYCCSSRGLLLNALNCVSIGNGAGINVDIPDLGLGQKAATTPDNGNNHGCGSGSKPFCCTSSGIINAGNCISLLDGLQINIG